MKMNENGYYIPPEDEEPKATEAKEPETPAVEEPKAADAEPIAPASETQTPPPPPSPKDTRSSVITRACSSGMFMALCILSLIYTVISAFPVMSYSFIEGSAFFVSEINIPIISLLITIGLWVIYTSAGKGEFPASGMKLVSGSLKAARIILWIIMIALIVAGAIFIVGGALTIYMGKIPDNIISFDLSDLDEVSYTVSEMLPYEYAVIVEGFLEKLNDPDFLGTVLVVLGIVFLVASIVSVIYVIFFSYLYKFARSLREWGEGEGFGIRAVRGAANWLMVMGVFSCIGALSMSPTAALSAAIFIVSSVFIKRSFAPYAE